jgi:hypothetical protein
MTFRRLGISVSLMFLVAAVFAAGPRTGQVPVKPKQALTVQFRPPTDLKICTNCARLDVRIFSLPGDGCLHCDDLATYLGVYAFIDPDLYVQNQGTLPSNPGTVTLEWYDLVSKNNATVSVAIPAVAPGTWEAVGLPCTHMMFIGTEGIKMTINYSDSAGARSRIRRVRKCPDN